MSKRSFELVYCLCGPLFTSWSLQINRCNRCLFCRIVLDRCRILLLFRLSRQIFNPLLQLWHLLRRWFVIFVTPIFAPLSYGFSTFSRLFSFHFLISNNFRFSILPSLFQHLLSMKLIFKLYDWVHVQIIVFVILSIIVFHFYWLFNGWFFWRRCLSYSSIRRDNGILARGSLFDTVFFFLCGVKLA